jgi:two-component system nitrate/nitrite sensor histidine kinase NarX
LSLHTSKHRTRLAATALPARLRLPKRSACLSDNRLIWPAAGLFIWLLVACVGGVLAASFAQWAVPFSLLQTGAILIAGAMAVLLLVRVQKGLLEPLRHMRTWAQRMGNGDLSARIPVPPGGGECARLARDINSLGEEFKLLSWDMESQVNKQTERLAQKTRSLQLLYDVAASINMSRDLDELLTCFLHTLIEVVHAEAGTVRLLTDDGSMRLVASSGLGRESAEQERLVPVNRCLSGMGALEGTVVRQASVQPCDPRVGQSFLDAENMEMIAVPLQYRGKTLGVYNLFGHRNGMIMREDLTELLTTIGQHLGMAIEKAHLDREATRLSIMEERTQIAHELHDSLAQTLASMRFQARMLDDNVEGGDALLARRQVTKLKNTLDEAYAELRELIAHFRAPLDKRGLGRALEGLIKRFRNETGMHTLFQRSCEALDLPADLEMQVLRIVQESLANIRKHSQAQTVRVLIKCEPAGEFHVLIEDDGVGFDERVMDRTGAGEHIGLSIMQQRARRLGGEFKIESEPGEGTRVMLDFPPRERAQRQMAG